MSKSGVDLSISRRTFLKISGITLGTLVLPAPAMIGAPAFPLHKKLQEGTTICPYCSVGCGLIVATDEKGVIVNSEGDADHPINEGALDPKSVSVRQLSSSPLRLHAVKYRAPGSTDWEEKDWEWALDKIAQRIKETRDATFEETDSNGVKVNRTEGIAWLGGAANSNEDCYMAVKFARGLGLVNIEHQARI